MSFCLRGCGKQGRHPTAAIPPTAFGEERTFRRAKSFNPGLPYPPPPPPPQHQSGGQNPKCQEGRRRGCKLTGGTQAPLGEPRPEASAGCVSQTNACVLMLSYLNFSPRCEYPRRAGVFQGCRKLGLEPLLSSRGLLPRVWPHSGHDVHEGCPPEGGSNLGWVADFPPNGKQGTKRGPEYPRNVFGEGKAKKDKLQWEGPPNILSARKTQLPKPSPWGRIRRNKESSCRVLVFPFCPEGARGWAVETSSPRFRNSIHEAAR